MEFIEKLKAAETVIKTTLKEAEAAVHTAWEDAQVKGINVLRSYLTPDEKVDAKSSMDAEGMGKTGVLPYGVPYGATAGVTAAEMEEAKLALLPTPAASDSLPGDSHDLSLSDVQENIAPHAETTFHTESEMPVGAAPVVDVVGVSAGSVNVWDGH